MGFTSDSNIPPFRPVIVRHASPGHLRGSTGCFKAFHVGTFVGAYIWIDRATNTKVGTIRAVRAAPEVRSEISASQAFPGRFTFRTRHAVYRGAIDGLHDNVV